MLMFLKNEEKQTLLFLFISLIALVSNFFDIGGFPFNPAWVAIVLCGFPILKEATIGLATEFDIKADVLVSVALLSAVVIGEIFAAGEVAFIMAIGSYLEKRTVAKARAGIEKLVKLTPATARVVKDGAELVVLAEEVKIGDVLRVLAGETIAVDGIIVRGETSVDQSVMTGESLPVDKVEGDEVKSGTVNQFGTFEMVAAKVGEDSSLQRMIRLVESADAGKAKVVRITDRWATWIVVAAFLSAIGTWFFTGEAIRAVTILVVFCPCALVLATPTAIMAGIGNASKFGILISRGDALERLAGVKRIAFDKTGTLTYGKPSVVGIEVYTEALTKGKLLEIAATAELRSEHPLGRAIVSHYRKECGKLPPEPDDFRLVAGRGVYATTAIGEILAGNESILEEKSVLLSEGAASDVRAAKSSGYTVIYLIGDGALIGGYSTPLEPYVSKLRAMCLQNREPAFSA